MKVVKTTKKNKLPLHASTANTAITFLWLPFSSLHSTWIVSLIKHSTSNQHHFSSIVAGKAHKTHLSMTRKWSNLCTKPTRNSRMTSSLTAFTTVSPNHKYCGRYLVKREREVKWKERKIGVHRSSGSIKKRQDFKIKNVCEENSIMTFSLLKYPIVHEQNP